MPVLLIILALVSGTVQTLTSAHKVLSDRVWLSINGMNECPPPWRFMFIVRHFVLIASFVWEEPHTHIWAYVRFPCSCWYIIITILISMLKDYSILSTMCLIFSLLEILIVTRVKAVLVSLLVSTTLVQSLTNYRFSIKMHWMNGRQFRQSTWFLPEVPPGTDISVVRTVRNTLIQQSEQVPSNYRFGLEQ